MESNNSTFKFKKYKNDIVFKNDLGVTGIGDPFMLKVSEKEYFMYCTSAPDGFYVWESHDMIHWIKKDMCYKKEEGGWNYECFWAPEVIFYNNTYYMFYTARALNGSLKIGLALSPSPLGPFKDYKNEPLFDFGYATIDGNPFIDDDGKKYLYFSRDCSENIIGRNHVSELYVVRLKDDLRGVEGTPIKLTTPSQPWESIKNGWGWNEGPEMLKHNGKYYLTYSANCFTDPLYSLGVAVSESPTGPFRKYDLNPILSKGNNPQISGPGHHGFIMSPDGTELWITYHTHTDVTHPSGDRKVNLASVSFDKNDNLIINGPTTSQQLRPSGSGLTNISQTFKEVEPLLFKSSASQPVKALAIHFTSGKPIKGQKIRLILNKKIISEEVNITSRTISPLILKFDAIYTNEIKIMCNEEICKVEIAK